jgi:hypothetical protein
MKVGGRGMESRSVFERWGWRGRRAELCGAQPDEAPADRIGTGCAWLIVGWLRGWDEVPCIHVSLMVNNASHLSRKGRGAAITP